MTHTTTNRISIALIITAFIALMAVFFMNGQTVRASVSPGVAATIATTSPASVSTTASTLFATSTCSARIISTVASPVMLTFSENQNVVPTGTFGVLQPASTTVAYDNGQYGCGAVQAYSFVASTITVSESR